VRDALALVESGNSGRPPQEHRGAIRVYSFEVASGSGEVGPSFEEDRRRAFRAAL
jgi:hypothetical protein